MDPKPTILKYTSPNPLQGICHGAFDLFPALACFHTWKSFSPLVNFSVIIYYLYPNTCSWTKTWLFLKVALAPNLTSNTFPPDEKSIQSTASVQGDVSEERGFLRDYDYHHSTSRSISPYPHPLTRHVKMEK